MYSIELLSSLVAVSVEKKLKLLEFVLNECKNIEQERDVVDEIKHVYPEIYIRPVVERSF